MYAEELKHKKLNDLIGILIVLGMVFALYWLVVFVSALQIHFGVVWIQFILYGGLFFVGYYIIKRFLTEYIYLIEKDRVTFGRRIGKREKELAFMPLRDIIEFGEYDALAASLPPKKRVYKYTFKKKQGAFLIIGKDFSVVMSVTDAYKDCLKNAKNGNFVREESDE